MLGGAPRKAADNWTIVDEILSAIPCKIRWVLTTNSEVLRGTSCKTKPNLSNCDEILRGTPCQTSWLQHEVHHAGCAAWRTQPPQAPSMCCLSCWQGACTRCAAAFGVETPYLWQWAPLALKLLLLALKLPFHCQRCSALLLALKLTFGVEIVSSGVESATSGVASSVEINLWRWIHFSMPEAGVEDPLGIYVPLETQTSSQIITFEWKV